MKLLSLKKNVDGEEQVVLVAKTENARIEYTLHVPAEMNDYVRASEIGKFFLLANAMQEIE